MGVDEAGDQKLSFSRNHGRTDRLLRMLFSLDADDAVVLDEPAAHPDVIEALWRDDGHVSDPGLACRLV